MNTHANNKEESKGQSAAHKTFQKNNSSILPLQLLDNRPEAVAQKKMQETANQGNRAMQLKALQEMADKSPQVSQTAQLKSMAGKVPIQLFKGAARTNQAGANVPFTLDQEFTDKHVADDETGAIANTQTRITTVGDAGGALIRAGTIGNTVATNGAWTTAINANADVIPEHFMGPSATERTTPGFNAGEYDDDGRTGDSSYMQVSAWEVKYKNNALSAEQKTVNRRVSGDYTVTNLDVSTNIDHCTQ